ncbi:sigma-54-dependent Fis family transcriptional regulator [Candidatus Saganbacteria bacterium]|nr:sigma-54-dependent Fis family transcriptional regulator [Candidatus Saganbacteria bacterium]
MKPTVLVVDDELSIRESFKLILADRYRVVTAASGEAGVKHAEDENPELIYLDIRMPGMNGLETLRKIKEIRPEQEVIMVTAVNDLTKASEAIKFGARDYLVKPFDVDKILKLTADLISRRHIKEEARKVVKDAANEKIPELLADQRPLNERMGDIPLLLDYFLESHSLKYGRRLKLSVAARETLSAYDYPGNVEELSGLVELLVLNSEKDEIVDLPLNILLAAGQTLPLEDLYARHEKQLIGKVLSRVGGDRARAAQLLGISSQVLETKI